MALLDCACIDSYPKLCALLLHTDSQALSFELHYIASVHNGIFIYIGRYMHFSGTIECPDSGSDDTYCVLWSDCFYILGKDIYYH